MFKGSFVGHLCYEKLWPVTEGYADRIGNWFTPVNFRCGCWDGVLVV